MVLCYFLRKEIDMQFQFGSIKIMIKHIFLNICTPELSLPYKPQHVISNNVAV